MPGCGLTNQQAEQPRIAPFCFVYTHSNEKLHLVLAQFKVIIEQSGLAIFMSAFELLIAVVIQLKKLV
jgi:hypothetical protein